MLNIDIYFHAGNMELSLFYISATLMGVPASITFYTNVAYTQISSKFLVARCVCVCVCVCVVNSLISPNRYANIQSEFRRSRSRADFGLVMFSTERLFNVLLSDREIILSICVQESYFCKQPE